MITCPSCGKRNQDHYKFCLACGAELPRSTGDEQATQAMPTFDEEISDEETAIGTGDDAPPAAAKEEEEEEESPLSPPDDAAPSPEPDEPVMVEEAEAADADADADADAEVVKGPTVDCPDCAYPNPVNNRFCSGCGGKLEPAAAPPPQAEEDSGISLVALSPEGGEIGTYKLPKGSTIVGRDLGGVFKSDRFLSPKHATFTPEGRRVKVRDEGSLNGVFRKLVPDQRYPLEHGQMFRIGQELLRFQALEDQGVDEDGTDYFGADADDFIGRIALVVGRDTTSPAFPVSKWGVNLGRERGHVLFSDDGYVSGLHCRLTYEDGRVFITDLGSSNGTFLRLLTEEWVSEGDVLLMGQQLFRVTT